MILFWKKLNLVIQLLTQGREGVSVGIVFATMLLHSWYHIIWYVHRWPCSEKVENRPWKRGGIAGKIFATMLPHFCMRHSLSLICNITIFWKGWSLTIWPHPLGQGEGYVGKSFATILLHTPFPLIWYAAWPYSEKNNESLPLSHPLVYQRDRTQAFNLKSCMICFIYIVPLSAFEILVKILTTDWIIANSKYLTWTPP